jgi:hypothetical protein
MSISTPHRASAQITGTERGPTGFAGLLPTIVDRLHREQIDTPDDWRALTPKQRASIFGLTMKMVRLVNAAADIPPTNTHGLRRGIAPHALRHPGKPTPRALPEPTARTLRLKSNANTAKVRP